MKPTTLKKKELIMSTGNADADKAILDMLQRYEVLTMDALSSLSQIFVGQNCFSRSVG